MEPALCPWDSPGKNTGVGCHLLLEGIFPTQGSNPCLLHCRRILYHWATREAQGFMQDGKCTVNTNSGPMNTSCSVLTLRPPPKTPPGGSGPRIRGRPPAPGQAFPVAITRPPFISRLRFLCTNTADQCKVVNHQKQYHEPTETNTVISQHLTLVHIYQNA